MAFLLVIHVILGLLELFLILNSRKINQRIFFLMIMFKIIFVLWHAQNFLTTYRMRRMC